ncbi:MAG: RNA polymerase sigma-70 factor [Bacteroidales bacterium]|jgi:RNA polymerase sigma-70 factor (ECF subfamily)|nr:RNA polymerase sigma-70 factor [Bacteroidales bacterium]
MKNSQTNGEQESVYFLKQLEQLYKRHAAGMLFFARKFVDFETAEDIVHDVFLKLCTRDSILIIEQTIGSYLFNAVKNACFDNLKHKIVEDDYMNRVHEDLKMDEFICYDDTVNRLIDEEQIEFLHKAINQLPERCKEIFTLAYLEEKNNAEVAQMLNISVRTVESQIYKALKILRKILTAFVVWING